MIEIEIGENLLKAFAILGSSMAFCVLIYSLFNAVKGCVNKK